jgi:prophage antirepressor-like protein
MAKLKRSTGTVQPKKITTNAQTAISRSEILDEIWAANKVTHNGKWYVCLSDVCAILGEDYVSREA